MAGGGIIVPPGIIRESTLIADQWANNERPQAAAVQPYIGLVRGTQTQDSWGKERRSRVTDVGHRTDPRSIAGRVLQDLYDSWEKNIVEKIKHRESI